jgi:hypothetical protein
MLSRLVDFARQWTHQPDSRVRDPAITVSVPAHESN